MTEVERGTNEPKEALDFSVHFGIIISWASQGVDWPESKKVENRWILGGPIGTWNCN
jgi:hypothetical protein